MANHDGRGHAEALAALAALANMCSFSGINNLMLAFLLLR